MDFGVRLRQVREGKGISLREIASATKISVSALEALERNDLARLPGGIFTRSFVRSYAIEIGLDPDQAVREFVSQFPDEATAPELDKRSESSEEAQAEAAPDGNRVLVWLLGGGLVVALVVVYFSGAGLFSRNARVPSAPAQAPVAVATPAPAVDPASPPGAAPSPVATDGESTDVLSIRVAPKGPCWVAATVDGQRRLGRVLQPGEQETVQVQEEVVLIIGDAGAFDFAINGAAGRQVGAAGQVVTLRINKTNFRTFLRQ